VRGKRHLPRNVGTEKTAAGDSDSPPFTTGPGAVSGLNPRFRAYFPATTPAALLKSLPGWVAGRVTGMYRMTSRNRSTSRSVL